MPDAGAGQSAEKSQLRVWVSSSGSYISPVQANESEKTTARNSVEKVKSRKAPRFANVSSAGTFCFWAGVSQKCFRLLNGSHRLKMPKRPGETRSRRPNNVGNHKVRHTTCDSQKSP